MKSSCGPPFAVRADKPGVTVGTFDGEHEAAAFGVAQDAAVAADTDWCQIVALYDQLLALAPTPVVALNRAVAAAEADGPAAALAAVDELGGDLARYHLFHATRADLLRRLGRVDEAADAYARAHALASNPAERAFLSERAETMLEGSDLRRR